MPRRFLSKLLNFFRRGRAEREMAREIEAHLALIKDEYLRKGMSKPEAEFAARRAFGGVEQARELHRDERSFVVLERFSQDLRQACRGLARTPGFTAVATVTLALGLGATTAIFSIVNGVLLQPLQYREPGRLYLARTVPPAAFKTTRDFPINARHFHEWRTLCRSCEQVSLIQFQYLTLVGPGEPVRLPALSVSSNFFKTLGVQPSLGRDFLSSEEAPGPWDRVILTEVLWRTRFGGDPSIIGRAIQINGEQHTVVGVMPPTLHLPRGDHWGPSFGPSATPLIFRPLHVAASQVGPVGNLNYASLIRLKPGVQQKQATAELIVLLGNLLREFNVEYTTRLIPMQQQVTRGARSALWLLLGTVGALLLIVCANVGNLMLVRTIGRYREAGVRLALGASRVRLFSLVLQEALMLVLIGGALGVTLAYVGLQMFVATAPIDLPRLDEVQISWRVLSFAGLAAALSAIACGLFPAWRLARTGPLDSLKASSTNSTATRSKLRLREVIVGIEVALTTVLLTVGALLMFSFLRVMQVETGFQVEHVITQDVSFLNPKYTSGGRGRFVEETLPKLAGIPGVEAAGVTNQLPLEGEDFVSDLSDPDQPPRALEDSTIANFRFVSPGYWTAMGIPLIQGRFLEESDKGRPTAVISERVAQFLWPGEDPIGKHVRGVAPQPPALEVVGVVGEVRAAVEDAPPMMVYEHYWRKQPVGMSFVVRAQTDPTAVAKSVREILSSADPEMAIAPARTMGEIFDDSVAARKYQTYLASAFALSALLLVSLGIFGVISFTVARRIPEIGIRMALGAREGQLMALTIRQGMIPVVLGLLVGLACAMSLSRVIGSQLYGVTPNDPIVILAVASTLAVLSICACWIPARRVTQIDPVVALRFE